MKILITGASSGIGYSMATYLAQDNNELFLVSRDQKKLQKKYQNFQNKITYIGLDLSIEENCYKLYNQLSQEKLDLLINNAGFGDAGSFHETSLKKELKMIDVNIKAYHILTKLFLKDFIKRDKGRILNIASIAGFMPGPYMACYYATKAYVVNLTLAIHEELKKAKSHVKISVFCPGPVETNFNNVAKVNFNVSSITPEYAAKYAIDNLFLDKLVIIPPNMYLTKALLKIAPLSLILLVNSNAQERVTESSNK